jgi:hypothetical protein
VPEKRPSQRISKATSWQTPEIDAPSICVSCAKDPSLKRFVETHGGTGNRCGICHRTDKIASDPKHFEALAGLTPHKRGPKCKRNPQSEEIQKLRRENQRLTEELRKAAIVMDAQKKVGALLGWPLSKADPEEKP